VRRLGPLSPLIPFLLLAFWLAGQSRVVLGVFLIGHELVQVMFVVPEPEAKPGGL
jgi:hypothetical protein